MLNWPYRHHLGHTLRLRRSLYEVLRDQLDSNLVKLALIDSYWNFTNAGEPYPFAQKRELKPRARIADQEHARQNHFFIIFCEGTIPSEHKKYIRFFDSNKMTKEAIEKLPYITLHKNYTNNLKYFNNPSFPTMIKDLTPVDYALLIQNAPSAKNLSRYMMTHFHVRVDWPIDEATEEMATHLRYITKDLYENGEQYAEQLYHKLFEYYGFHHSVGGRRTAAVVAAQFLKRMNFISTVYVASAEDRTLTRLSERGVSKFVLIRLPVADIEKLATEYQIQFDTFCDRYLVNLCNNHGVAILNVVYRNSAYSKSPEDGKLRKLQPDYQWLNIHDQLLLPLPDQHDAYPLRYNTIYSTD
ncbi:MAG: hypothetical protein KKD63_04350 [Proteobacteria bacterium]|nr:hypothetical protein [Desulfobulbaceae bacterium]MBU4152092.1 hypothetical protein [Pseudomonadota bacterium]